MQTYLVFVATSGSLGELDCLISIERLLYIVDFNDEVLFFRLVGSDLPVLGIVAGRGGSRGSHSLPLAAHVTSLRLLRLREVLVYIPDIHQGPGEKIAWP